MSKRIECGTVVPMRLPELTRRAFVRQAGAIGLLALVPPARLKSLLASAPTAGKPGRFLTARELDTLRAVCDRLIPGPPEDPSPGALQAGVAEAIDLLLGAFEVSPPLIHAGGPFSDRAGARHDNFADFVALDRQSELGWRIRLEGSRGMREREFAGPVTGLQEIYRDGLAYLDQRSQQRYRVSFAQAPITARDELLDDLPDERLQRFVGAALANALEAMYGPPEYGGNRDLVGWSSNGWRGDSQPDGYSREQVTQPDPQAPSSGVPAVRVDHPLPDLSGRPAARDALWLRRGRLGRR